MPNAAVAVLLKQNHGGRHMKRLAVVGERSDGMGGPVNAPLSSRSRLNANSMTG